MSAAAYGDHRGDLDGREHPGLLRAIDMVAPGSALREGVDNIIHARTGGLVVLGDTEDISFLFSGGIKLDVDYSPALLYQLAKMDGAIVLDAMARQIRWANVQLMPDPTIHSSETGTRHRTAERVSRQTDALVISVSARRDVVTLYIQACKYILREIPMVLSKANQGLATLDRYRERFDQATGRLTDSELSGNPATLHEVLTAIQRAELVLRTAAEVERYIIELGSEGRLIEMQLEDTVVGVHAERAALIRDYGADAADHLVDGILSGLGGLPHQDLLDFGRMAEILGYDRKVNAHEVTVSPRGYRVLNRIPRLPRLIAETLIKRFGGLSEIIAASRQELAATEGVGEGRADEVRQGLRRLIEIDAAERYMQT